MPALRSAVLILVAVSFVFSTGSSGARVRDLRAARAGGNYYEAQWDGRDNRGKPVSAGIYLYRLKTGDGVFTRKMVLLK